jgi:hypothetical protein
MSDQTQIGQSMMNARCRFGSTRAKHFGASAGFSGFPPTRDAELSVNRIMFNAYVIEIDDEAVGIAARGESGYRFHASAHAFNALDGQVFSTVRQAAAAAQAPIAAKALQQPRDERPRAQMLGPPPPNLPRPA